MTKENKITPYDTCAVAVIGQIPDIVLFSSLTRGLFSQRSRRKLLFMPIEQSNLAIKDSGCMCAGLCEYLRNEMDNKMQ